MTSPFAPGIFLLSLPEKKKKKHKRNTQAGDVLMNSGFEQFLCEFPLQLAYT